MRKDFQLTLHHRPDVELTLDDGRIITGRRGAPLEEFAEIVQEEDQPQIVGMILDGSLRELTYPLNKDGVARLISMSDSDGARIYRRSLVFLLEVAFKNCFPEGKLTIDHSVSSGGYHCQIDNLDGFGQAQVEELQEYMRRLVSDDIPFIRETVPLQEAIDYFSAAGELDKVSLLKYRQRSDLVLYRANNVRDYHHGYMVPSSGYLKWFALELVDGGFVLRFPRRHSPKALQPLGRFPTLLKTFKEYGEWLNRLGIPSVGALNDAIQDGHIDEVILVSEALHEMQISNIADQIYENREKVGVILIAGPTSSGKTTFSKRLGIQLVARGINHFALEMDNFFVDREKTPLLPDGTKDYESLRAMNLERMNHDVKALLAGQEVQLPRYDFFTGLSGDGKVARLDKGDIVILEGIHGLNPDLLPEIDPANTFRIYISCLTQLNLDRHNRISTTDTRMIRRIVRDARDRGYSASQTIARWESVRMGEKQHIFTYQEHADVMFNSALAYEISTLKPLVEPLLRQVSFGTVEHIEAKRLLKFLEWFLPTTSEFVPDNSILREFIGDSILTDFSMWRR
ncbi:MAG: nucleoside kinase [Anaerolineaceae bacterium]|jgi:uridine kinase|nr:nucleoside kinase [Anaerolineaceae bacterium]MDD4042997.1 nucleoside kinase [Anaerolineaceae bacterium]MDD4578238.1 nucleoside kinase [Anaerolineaceae bacterium]